MVAAGPAASRRVSRGRPNGGDRHGRPRSLAPAASAHCGSPMGYYAAVGHLSALFGPASPTLRGRESVETDRLEVDYEVHPRRSQDELAVDRPGMFWGALTPAARPLRWLSREFPLHPRETARPWPRAGAWLAALSAAYVLWRRPRPDADGECRPYRRRHAGPDRDDRGRDPGGGVWAVVVFLFAVCLTGRKNVLSAGSALSAPPAGGYDRRASPRGPTGPATHGHGGTIDVVSHSRPNHHATAEVSAGASAW